MDQKSGVRHKAESMYKKIDTLQFSFMIVLWISILERFDAISTNLQRGSIGLSCIVKLCGSLEMCIRDIRNRFDNILAEAKQISGHENFLNEGKRKKNRKKKVFTMTQMFKKHYFVDKKI